MNKKLVVYLHGFGNDENDNLNFQNELKNNIDCEYLSLRAPLDSGRDRGGYAWYPLTPIVREHMVEGYLEDSMAYVKSIIKNKLQEFNMSYSDVILVGRSQGGFLSMVLALKLKQKVHAVVSLCSGILSTDIKLEINSNPKILWVEAKKDTVLKIHKKESYKNLNNLDIIYNMNEKSDHDNLDISIIDFIVKNID